MDNSYIKNIEAIPEGINVLKQEKNIYLYGNGIYAEKVIDILQEFNVVICGVLVSKEYYLDDFFMGYDVYQSEEFIENSKKDIIIIAGYDILLHQNLTEKLISEKKIKKIYVMNGCDYLWRNGWKFPNTKVFLIDNYYQGIIKRKLDFDYFNYNFKDFEVTYHWLDDEKSMKIMENYLKGHIELANFPMMEMWNINDVENQYFPEDIICLSENEVFVDCGAYTGDTLDCFLKRVKSFKKYYALEPDPRRAEELKPKVKKNMIHIPIGAWNKTEYIPFSLETECGEIKTEQEIEKYSFIKVDTIDNVIGRYEKVTFIKMDIEGAELKALQGAQHTIRRDKPTLAICVYHKREDLIVIPQYIKSLVPEYKIYLRAHFPYVSELVLYAICK